MPSVEPTGPWALRVEAGMSIAVEVGASMNLVPGLVIGD
jgi:hypothetical protein